MGKLRFMSMKPFDVGCSMKKTLFTGAIAAGALVAGGVLHATPAQAASISTNACSPTVAGLVNSTLGCEVVQGVSGNTNDWNNLTTVNAAGFFGLSDWEKGAKVDFGDNAKGNKSGTTGTWDFSSILSSLPSGHSAMILFKGGKGTAWTSYLIDAPSVTSGTWKSPLFDGSKGKTTSHISLYTSSSQVPTPALLPGLIGMGVAAYRKRRGEVAEA